MESNNTNSLTTNPLSSSAHRTVFPIDPIKGNNEVSGPFVVEYKRVVYLMRPYLFTSVIPITPNYSSGLKLLSHDLMPEYVGHDRKLSGRNYYGIPWIKANTSLDI